AGGMPSELEKNLVHFKGGENGFDQNRGSDGASRNSHFILREQKDIIPKTCFKMAFHFRQIEVRASSLINQFLCVVKEVESKIEQRRRNRFPIHTEVPLFQMPPAGPHHKGGNSSVKTVGFAFRTGEADFAF